MGKRVLLRFLVIILLPTIIFLTFGQSSAAPPKRPAPSGTLTIAQIWLGEIMDPIRLIINDKIYLTLIFESLVGCNHNGQISTDRGISHKWDMSSDAKTWTFYLRKGIKFHNGDEVTADDVKFSLERVMSPAAICTYASHIRKTIDRIEVVDRYTVRVYCKTETPLLYYSLSNVSTEGYVVPKKYIEKHGDQYFGLHPIGTGPYKVVEIVGGSHVKMEAAFANHWFNGPPKYKYVVFKLVPEELARIGMIKTAEADIAQITAERVKEAKAAGLTILQDPSASVAFISINEQWDKKNPVYDKRVRQALALAINGKELFEQIFGGIGRLTGSATTIRNALGYVDLPPYPYDPQKAKELLREAGYPDGFKIKLHSFPTHWFPALPRTLEAIAGYLENIGIKSEIIPYADYAAYRAKYIAKGLGNGISGMESTGRTNPLPAMFLWWHKDSSLDYLGNPELSSMIDMANKTLDERERVGLIQKTDKYVHDNYHFLWAFEVAWPYVISKKLGTWEMGTLAWDINLEHVLMWDAAF